MSENKEIDRQLSIFSSDTKRFDLHLSESQRVVIASPVTPVNTISVRRVVASEIAAIEIGLMTVIVPPATFVQQCT